MSPTQRKLRQRRAKKSYTLSPESVAFLETLKKKRRARSISSILEDILQGVRRGQEKMAVQQAVADYYSSLADEAMNEQAAWGAFALGEFPKEVA